MTNYAKFYRRKMFISPNYPKNVLPVHRIPEWELACISMYVPFFLLSFHWESWICGLTVLINFENLAIISSRLSFWFPTLTPLIHVKMLYISHSSLKFCLSSFPSLFFSFFLFFFSWALFLMCFILRNFYFNVSRLQIILWCQICS